MIHDTGATLLEFEFLCDAARTPKSRTLREFAEQEIVIPDGPFGGMRFDCGRQPYTRLFFDEVDSGRWNRFMAVGPTQSGKTLTCFVVPTLWSIFELNETTVLGQPTIDMAADKWQEDLLPVIRNSSYRGQLPDTGSGSRKGKVVAIKFRNGVTLRFMTGGGNDQSRAGFTARVVSLTEINGMADSNNTSKEADKVKQLEGRARAYDDQKLIFGECTQTDEQGRIEVEYQEGSASRIACRCPECHDYVTPEREHLIGYKEAKTALEAKKNGAFICPSCGVVWTEGDRREANLNAVLVHKGQEVGPEGELIGDYPETETLGFRWNAFNNLLVSSGSIAMDEWKAMRANDEENAEKEMCQQVWAIPYKPPFLDLTALDARTIIERIHPEHRGVVPKDVSIMSAMLDLGKHICHYTVMGFTPDGSPRVIDYGVIETHFRDHGEEQGLIIAMNQFRDILETGYPQASTNMIPEIALIDSGGTWGDVVYKWVRANQDGPISIFPMKGYGESQNMESKYTHPAKKGPTVRNIGEGYHTSRFKHDGKYIHLIRVNADQWKSYLHNRIGTPIGEPGALTLYDAGSTAKHLTYAKHLTAEKKIEEMQPGKGRVILWVHEGRPNHYLDTAYGACAAGHMAGVRLDLSASSRPESPQDEPQPKAAKRSRRKKGNK